jgi:hypothetical protein
MPDGGKQRKSTGSSLAQQVAQGLRERVPQYLMTEEYGPDGEIVEAWEGHPIDLSGEGPRAVIFCHEGAEPRRDWRERGVIPPRGYHRRVGGE